MSKIQASKENEIKLIEMACKGDKEAFNHLVSMYNKMLIRYIEVRINNIHDAEDIAQNIWLKVFENIQKSPDCGGYDSEKGRFYIYVTKVFAEYEILHYRNTLSRAKEDEYLHDVYRRQLPPDILMINKENYLLKFKTFLELFHLAFLCGGYPHQQLAFGYSKLIYGKRSSGNRMIEGNSKKLNKEYGTYTLRNLADSFWNDFSSLSEISSDALNNLQTDLTPLYKRLELPVEILFNLCPILTRQLHSLHSQFVGHTLLKDYYTDKRGFDSAIPDWCNKVENRIRSILGLKSELDSEEIIANSESVPSKCNKCKLRHVVPCGQICE